MGTLGLALSGGGARGIAHLGVLQALDELEVAVHEISGTSSGAMIGAFYSAGVSPIEVLELLQKTKLLKFVRPAVSRTGLLKVEKLSNFFSKHLPVTKFEELNKALTVTATDIEKGEIRYFDQGELIPAVLASSCIPVIFDPVEIDGIAYVDGGILNNLPVEPLTESCSVIIGSHSNPVDDGFKVKNAKALLERTFLMAIRNNVLPRQDQCTWLIEPPELGKYIGSDFHKAEELFKIGYDYVLQHKASLFELLNR